MIGQFSISLSVFNIGGGYTHDFYQIFDSSAALPKSPILELDGMAYSPTTGTVVPIGNSTCPGFGGHFSQKARRTI